MKAIDLFQSIAENMELVLKGKREVIELVLISCFCEGHILLEDVPGTGKTTLAKALARSLDCDFTRLQFTPDLLPSDITGSSVYHRKTEEFIFQQGAVFTNIMLADELNRAMPRSQSALLECMEERQVSAEGKTYPLEPPFLVIATQNPIETQGTFPLPEAQLDRFLMRLSLGYPDTEHERQMMEAFRENTPLTKLCPVAAKEDLLAAQREVRAVSCKSAVEDYILNLVSETRNNSRLRLGLSPRGTLALLRAAQGKAAVQGRDYVLPDDVKAVFMPVSGHRVLLQNFQTGSEAAKAELQKILDQTPVPKE